MAELHFGSKEYFENNQNFGLKRIRSIFQNVTLIRNNVMNSSMIWQK